MNWYIVLWVVSLHVLGAITFFNMIEGYGEDDLKKSLNQLPNYLRVIILLFWPYIMLYWLISGKFS